jgi:hypothetical protein
MPQSKNILLFDLLLWASVVNKPFFAITHCYIEFSVISIMSLKLFCLSLALVCSPVRM